MRAAGIPVPAVRCFAAIWLLRGGGNGVPDRTKGFSQLLNLPEAPLPDKSCVPLPADAGAVIAGAEEIVRRAAGREEARQRRRGRTGQERRRRQAGRDLKAAERRERERAEEERLRAEADGARRAGAPWGRRLWAGA